MAAVLDTDILSSQNQAEIVSFLGGCNDYMTRWSAERDYAEVTAALCATGAVHAPVCSAAEIVQDPHFLEREAVVTLPDEEPGPITMQGIVPNFPGRDHAISHPGRGKGRDNDAFYAGLGFTAEELAALRDDGII